MGIGRKEKTAFIKLVKIIKDVGYKGYLPVETLLRGVTYDSIGLLPKMLNELTAAIEEVYKK